MIISPPKYDYAVKEVIKVVDADTYDLCVGWTVDSGFFLKEEKSWTTRFRLYGIDAVESHSPQGPIATEYVKNWLHDRAGLLRCATYKPDNFGRWLADIYALDGYLRDAIRRAGFEKPDDQWAVL